MAAQTYGDKQHLFDVSVVALVERRVFPPLTGLRTTIQGFIREVS